MRNEPRRLILTFGMGFLLVAGPGLPNVVAAEERAPSIRSAPATALDPAVTRESQAPARGAAAVPAGKASPATARSKQPSGATQRPEAQRAGEVAIMPGGNVGVQAPDLVPEHGAGASYCGWILQGNQSSRAIKIRIANHGNEIANPTNVFVHFDGSAYGASHPIGGYVYAGGFKGLNLAIPETCYDSMGVCSFQIAVDQAQAIQESNEQNNADASTCAAQ